MNADVVVIGGGIVGLATAHALMTRHDGASLVVLEKEPDVALHQTGRNSGVIHSGVYYRPGSLKATNCRRGKAMLEAFCTEHAVPFDVCGKVIVATDEAELPMLERIEQRGKANGVDVRPVDADELRELEPHARGIRALHVPEAGIVRFADVAQKLRELIERSGGRVVTGARVESIRSGDELAMETSAGPVRAKAGINCAGLFADRVARLAGLSPESQVLPFRGEYYELIGDATRLCRNLIYPVPNPDFPFLGVHLTRMIGGGVEVGPNAVLALSREGYRWRDVSVRDLSESARFPGSWKLIGGHLGHGLGEVHRSLSKHAFVRAIRRLVPSVRKQDLRRCRSGVRAQCVMPDGSLVDDFLFEESGRMVHVLNAPSPAATSALAIGETIVDRFSGVLTGS